MTKSKVFCAGLLVGMIYVPHGFAEPLRINPYPNVVQEQPAQVTKIEAAPVESLPVLPSPDVAVRPDISDFQVPQPGDPYFDSVGDSDAFVPKSKTPEQLPVVEVVEPLVIEEAVPSENITVRMSDSYDDLVINPEETRQRVASKQPQPVKAYEPEVSKPEEVIWYSRRTAMKTPAPEKVAESSAQRWKALEGSNIRQILERWTADADVELIWDNHNAFAVLEPFEVSASFEDAVQRLLDQYKDNQVRPLGTLHVDPETQKKTLVIKALRGS